MGNPVSDLSIALHGEMTIAGAGEYRKLFAEALQSGQNLVLRFEEGSTCDTAMLQLICSLHKTAVRRACGFRVEAVPVEVQATAETLGLPIHEWTGAGIGL